MITYEEYFHWCNSAGLDRTVGGAFATRYGIAHFPISRSKSIRRSRRCARKVLFGTGQLRLSPHLRSSALHPSTRRRFYAASPMMQKNGSEGAKMRSQAKTLQPVKRPLPPLQSSRFQKRKQINP